MNRSIVLLGVTLDVGGAEKQILLLATELARRGWDVRVVTLGRLGTMGESFEWGNVSHSSLNASSSLQWPVTLYKLVRLLREIEPTVIVNFLYHADVVGRIAATIARVPVVIGSVRSQNIGGWTRKIIMRIIRPLATYVTANAQATMDDIVSYGIASGDKSKMIPNAVSAPDYHEDSYCKSRLKAGLGIDKDSFLWVAVGRLEDAKDYPTLFAAFAILAEHASVSLVIVGDGSRRPYLETLLRRHGIDNRCVLVGLRNDVPRFLAIADGFVQASRWEGTPNSILEAMATGLPVVATRVGGVQEIITNELNGILVEPEDVSGLADAMHRVMRLDPEVRLAMANQGRHDTLERYSIRSVATQWEDLFSKELVEVLK